MKCTLPYPGLFDIEPVGFSGDWHGDTGWAIHAIQRLAYEGVGVIYQVGDFGIWGGHDGAAYLRKVQRELDAHDMLLIVTPGNHENYDMLDRWDTNDDGFACRDHDLPRIWAAPRGHIWTHHGATLASLGGAGSIDRSLRTPGKSWWPQEEITHADRDALAANMRAWGLEHVDVMLTHECPAGITLGRHGIASPEIEHYCYMQRVRLREATDIANPHTLVHGHWHSRMDHVLDGLTPDGRDYRTDILGLGMQGPGNLMIANLAPASGLIEVRTL